jgi:arylsulfate sulfotransferase
MNPRFKLLPGLFTVIAILALFSACHKDQPKPATVITAPSEILVAPFPNLTATVDFSSGSLIKMNYAGQITKQINLGVSAFNFKRWTIDGKIMYTYCLYDSLPATPLLGWLAGTDIITDQNLNVIQQIQIIGHPGHDARVDGHEFILLSPTHYITETYYSQVPTNIPDSVPHAAGCTVLAPFIQEVNNGQVVFEWNAADYPEFYGASVQGGDF